MADAEADVEIVTAASFRSWLADYKQQQEKCVVQFASPVWVQVFWKAEHELVERLDQGTFCTETVYYFQKVDSWTACQCLGQKGI